MNNLLNSQGQPLDENLDRALQHAGPATLYVARFYADKEVFFALGCWANPRLAAPPAYRKTGYRHRIVAEYRATERQALLPLAAVLLAGQPSYTPQLGGGPLQGAGCVLDPWPILHGLPPQARRAGPAVVAGPASALRPVPPPVRGLRRQLALAQTQLAQVRALASTSPVRVRLPLAAGAIWISVPAGDVRGAAEQLLDAHIQALAQQLAEL